ncbi:Dipeptidyl peptidase 1 [Morella rubra]|uniref:Dipeptidyl peptidase 1 n=1 Tax=Morella rubra TaxID=262757 RepID=A0A6A1WDT9_9ROSI|nr:Dipeptidyl peptidase 1 [Morella rubra]
MEGSHSLDIPNFWDWNTRSENLSLPVQNCRIKDSCWAIVTIEALTAAYRLKHPREDLPELSLQELIDCCREDEVEPYTYHFKKAFKWIQTNGIRREQEYPFQGSKNLCKPKTEEEGIYEGPKDPTAKPLGKHAVLIIGSGQDEEEEKNYWLVKRETVGE